MFIRVSDTVVRGTIQDLVKSGLKAKGSAVDQVALSVFGRYGVGMQKVGEEKPARGRSAAVYEVSLGDTFSL